MRGFTTEIKIIKQTKREIMELKNSVKEMKNILESTGIRADQIKERISDLEDGILEMIHVESERDIRFFYK